MKIALSRSGCSAQANADPRRAAPGRRGATRHAVVLPTALLRIRLVVCDGLHHPAAKRVGWPTPIGDCIEKAMTLFSVVIATRDRPASFAEALASVLAQDRADFEVIVVNDGSHEETREAYGRAVACAGAVGARLSMHWLLRRPRGHGPAFSRNFGAAQASGTFLCFLDDDDVWTDRDHLQRAGAILAATDADLYMAKQDAFRAGTRIDNKNLWVGGLSSLLPAFDEDSDNLPYVSVSVNDIMKVPGFCHLNTLIVKKSVFDLVGGMDECIRWEEDRDFFLRIIDTCTSMVFVPRVIARHNVPSAEQDNSASTSLALIERLLHQMRVLDKASIGSSHASITSHARQHKVYTLKRLAEALGSERRWTSASFYAREAFGLRPSVKWGAFCIYLHVMRCLYGERSRRE